RDLHIERAVRAVADGTDQICERQGGSLRWRERFIGRISYEIAFREWRFVGSKRVSVIGVTHETETPGNRLDVHDAVVILLDESLEQLSDRIEPGTAQGIRSIRDRDDHRLGVRWKRSRRPSTRHRRTTALGGFVAGGLRGTALPGRIGFFSLGA